MSLIPCFCPGCLVLLCSKNGIGPGSNAIVCETELSIESADRLGEGRLLLKNAPWGQIRERIANELGGYSREGSVQQQTERLMEVVTSAIIDLTPKAKPSPYAKRWRMTDLTQLRTTYTQLRNRAGQGPSKEEGTLTQSWRHMQGRQGKNSTTGFDNRKNNTGKISSATALTSGKRPGT